MSFATKAVPSRGVYVCLLLRGARATRAGLRMLIESRTGLRVVGEAASYADARVAGFQQADIVLLDSDLDRNVNLDFLNEIVVSVYPARLLILTGTADLESHYCAVRLGAMGLVLKERPADVLVKAIEIHAGEVWLDRSSIARVLRGLSSGAPSADSDEARIAHLTERDETSLESSGKA